MLKFLSPEELINYFLLREVRRVREKIQGAEPEQAYHLNLEPISALFADECWVTVDGVLDAYDPLKARVLSTVKIKWNKYAIEMFRELHRYGIDPRLYSRTGGPYQNTVANKVLAKWDKQKGPLLYAAVDLWRRP